MCSILWNKSNLSIRSNNSNKKGLDMKSCSRQTTHARSPLLQADQSVVRDYVGYVKARYDEILEQTDAAHDQQVSLSLSLSYPSTATTKRSA